MSTVPPTSTGQYVPTDPAYLAMWWSAVQGAAANSKLAVDASDRNTAAIQAGNAAMAQTLAAGPNPLIEILKALLEKSPYIPGGMTAGLAAELVADAKTLLAAMG